MNHPGSSKASERSAAAPLLQHLTPQKTAASSFTWLCLLTLNHLQIFCHSGRCHNCATATKPGPHSQATTRLLHWGLDAKCRLQINLEADTARLPWKPHKKPAVVWMSRVLAVLANPLSAIQLLQMCLASAAVTAKN